MKLGLVCISEILKAQSKNNAFQTMTRKRFNDLPRTHALAELSKRILHNAQLTGRVIGHCASIGIKHYRVSSNLFPLVTDETLGIQLNELVDLDRIMLALQQAGAVARSLGVSLSSHPDQFNVLPSLDDNTVERSIRELNHQSFVLDSMGCPQDYRAPMCLHLNRSLDPEKEDIYGYINRFSSAFNRCNEGVRKRLVLENEDKGFWNARNLHTYFNMLMPLVFDNLHDACNPSEDCYFDRFKSTWRHYTPVMHWSEGLESKPRSHSDYVSFVPSVVSKNADCVWEVEVKAKDLAIQKILGKKELA